PGKERKLQAREKFRRLFGLTKRSGYTEPTSSRGHAASISTARNRGWGKDTCVRTTFFYGSRRLPRRLGRTDLDPTLQFPEVTKHRWPNPCLVTPKTPAARTAAVG